MWRHCDNNGKVVLLFSVLHQQFCKREILKGNRSSFIVCPVALRYKLPIPGINWHSGHICAEHWSRRYRENTSADVPDIPVPASQLVTLEKKPKQAKAQLERKATWPAKQKVISLERKLFLAKQCSVISGSKKRKAPTERDQPTVKRSRKLSKRQLSTRLGASEEDKQLLTKQLTNTKDMVEKLRTENRSLKIQLRNVDQTRQSINKQNEELKIAVKRLQQEQFSYSSLIKKPTTFKYLCGFSVEQFNVLWNCMLTVMSSSILIVKVLGRDL